MPQKVMIIGPAWPLRGGLASFDERLARAFQAQGDDVSIITFSLQYPGFLFPGTTQYSSDPAPKDIRIHAWINSINPLNWLKIGRRLKKNAPNLIVVRFWLPFMGPCLGTILRIARKNSGTRIVCIADNIIPHEHRPGDKLFTRYFIGAVHAFITMSDKVLADLMIFTGKPARMVVHPLYDNFGLPMPKAAARKHIHVPEDGKLILFFGFIRAYKGLDLLLKAMADPRIKASGIHLLIAGEFYENRAVYDNLIQELGISHLLELRTDFIPDSEVGFYLSAADFVIQPYKHATQSGVTPLAYHFEKPMLVTNVGGLPSLVPDKKVGIIAEPDPTAIATGILELYELGEAYFLPHLRIEKSKYSWDNLVDAIRMQAGIS